LHRLVSNERPLRGSRYTLTRELASIKMVDPIAGILVFSVYETIDELGFFQPKRIINLKLSAQTTKP